jgi:hypothetical protein
VEWTLIAPLGELPDERALREIALYLEKRERPHRKRTLLGEAFSTYIDVVRSALESVRATEGIFSAQLDGGGAPKERSSSRSPVGTSVLAALGVHAERSVYTLRYLRKRTDGLGRVPDCAFSLRMDLRLSQNLEVQREVEAFERKLLDRHPGLRAVARKLEGRPLLGVLERGKLLFPVGLTGYCSQVLLGTTLLSLRFAHKAENLRTTQDIDLVTILIEEAILRPLPPQVIDALVRGEGNVKEAERVLAMERLSAF